MPANDTTDLQATIKEWFDLYGALTFRALGVTYSTHPGICNAVYRVYVEGGPPVSREELDERIDQRFQSITEELAAVCEGRGIDTTAYHSFACNINGATAAVRDAAHAVTKRLQAKLQAQPLGDVGAEAPKPMTYSVAAEHMTQRTGVRWDKGRISKEIESGKIQLAPGEQLTIAALDRRIATLKARNKPKKPATPTTTAGTCDRCQTFARERTPANGQKLCDKCFGEYAVE